MKRVLTILILSICSLSLKAQVSFEVTSDIEIRDENGDKLTLGTVGGLNQPQFYNLDINNDGDMDLFVFDRNGGKTLSLISDGAGNYTYDPKYDQIYPSRFTTWVVFKDYNNDDLPDLWFFDEDIDAISLYKNITKAGDSHAMFEVTDADLRAYNFNTAPLDTNDLYCDRTNIPAIEDLDGDGDIDFMTLQTLGFGITLFLNNTVESGKPLDPPSFEIADQCWGDFQEYDGSNEIKFEKDPFCFHKIYRHTKKKHAGGSSLLLLDSDGDSDMDLLMGNAGLDNLNLIINGKADFGMKIDSMISNDSLFPSNTVRANMHLFPAGYYQDVNGDGIRDLIVAVNSFAKASYTFREANSIFYYENTGKDDHPVFIFKDSMFLDRHMVDHGGFTSPILYDMDKDGDKDLIISTSGDLGIDGETADYLVYYENVGSKTNPIFQRKKEDYLGLRKESIARMSPCLGDLNRDGNPELLIGQLDGSLSLYNIVGTGTSATSNKVSDNTYGINVGQSSMPNLADVDGDGFVDLLVGGFDGNTEYYRNTSTTGVPAFTKLQDTLGGVLPGYWRLETQYDEVNNRFYDSLVFKNINNAAPQLMDLDGNGNPEFVIGDERGKVTIYRDVRNNLTKFGEAVEDPYYLSWNKTCYEYNFGSMAKPAYADINNDGKMDMVVGTERGGFQIAMGSGTCALSNGKSNFETQNTLVLYPNPTTGVIQFKGQTAYEAKLTVVNLEGQTVYSETINVANGVDLSFIPDGIYVVRLDSKTQSSVAKLIKLNK